MVGGYLRYAAHKCASRAQTGTHCDYLSFQTWKRQERVAKWERQYVMLTEIKTEAARHFGFILWILCFKTLLFHSSLFCLPFLILPPSSAAVAISLSLFSPSCPSLMHIRCHISLTLPSSLFLHSRLVVLQPELAASPPSFSHVWSSVWSSAPSLPFHSRQRLKGGVTSLPGFLPQEGLKRDNKN